MPNLCQGNNRQDKTKERPILSNRGRYFRAAGYDCDRDCGQGSHCGCGCHHVGGCRWPWASQPPACSRGADAPRQTPAPTDAALPMSRDAAAADRCPCARRGRDGGGRRHRRRLGGSRRGGDHCRRRVGGSHCAGGRRRGVGNHRLAGDRPGRLARLHCPPAAVCGSAVKTTRNKKIKQRVMCTFPHRFNTPCCRGHE